MVHTTHFWYWVWVSVYVLACMHACASHVFLGSPFLKPQTKKSTDKSRLIIRHLCYTRMPLAVGVPYNPSTRSCIPGVPSALLTDVDASNPLTSHVPLPAPCLLTLTRSPRWCLHFRWLCSPIGSWRTRSGFTGSFHGKRCNASWWGTEIIWSVRVRAGRRACRSMCSRLCGWATSTSSSRD